MQQLVDTIRRIARAEAEARWSPALGVVSSVHTGSGQPELSATIELRETGIVLPHVPIAVGSLGLAAPPAEGDLVLVAFAGGDLHAPVVVGRLYDDVVAAPQSAPGQVVGWLPRAETDAEKRLEFAVDTPDDGSRTLTLTLAGDVAVEVTVTDGEIRLAVGKATLTLTQSGSDDGEARVEVGDTSLTLSQSGDVTLEAAGKLTLSGDTVEIQGQSEVAVSAQTIKLN